MVLALVAQSSAGMHQILTDTRLDHPDGLVRLVGSMAVWLHSLIRIDVGKNDANALDALTSARRHVIHVQQGSRHHAQIYTTAAWPALHRRSCYYQAGLSR